MGQILGVPQSTKWRVLNGKLWNTYHVQPIQDLAVSDYLRRLELAHWFLKQSAKHPYLLAAVHVTIPTRDGAFYIRSVHVWVRLNPHARYSK